MRARPAAVFFRGVEREASGRHDTRSRPFGTACLQWAMAHGHGATKSNSTKRPISIHLTSALAMRPREIFGFVWKKSGPAGVDATRMVALVIDPVRAG